MDMNKLMQQAQQMQAAMQATQEKLGDMTVEALNEADADTQAIALAFADDAKTTVGAAVAINVADLDTVARVGNGTVTTGSLKVEAGTPTGETSEFKALALAGSGSTSVTSSPAPANRSARDALSTAGPAACRPPAPITTPRPETTRAGPSALKAKAACWISRDW